MALKPSDRWVGGVSHSTGTGSAGAGYVNGTAGGGGSYYVPYPNGAAGGYVPNTAPLGYPPPTSFSSREIVEIRVRIGSRDVGIHVMLTGNKRMDEKVLADSFEKVVIESFEVLKKL